MPKVYKGWEYISSINSYVYYADNTIYPYRYSCRVDIRNVRIYFYKGSGLRKSFLLTEWFKEPRSPNEDELTLFELETGVDLSYPLSKLF